MFRKNNTFTYDKFSLLNRDIFSPTILKYEDIYSLKEKFIIIIGTF